MERNDIFAAALKGESRKTLTENGAEALNSTCEAERIYDILSESKDPVDDATKSYAIQALTGIQESMSSSYYKSCVGDVIENILKI